MLQATVPQSPSRIARTDSKTGRFYTILDRVTGESVRYPSVTTILNVLNKPALLPWAAAQERALVAEAAADLYADLHGAQQLPRSMYQLALEQRLGKTKAHVKALQKASEIGTQCHSKLEWNLKRMLGQKVGPEPILSEAALWASMAAEDFCKEVQLQPRFIETVVFSRTHRYAGTLDVVATLDTAALLARLERQGAVETSVADWLRIHEMATVLIDIKTSKQVWPESFIQTTAYIRALAEMGHGRVDGGLIVRLPKLLTDPGFEVVVVPPARDLFPTFLACRQLFDWADQNEQAYQARRKAVA